MHVSSSALTQWQQALECFATDHNKYKLQACLSGHFKAIPLLN